MIKFLISKYLSKNYNYFKNSYNILKNYNLLNLFFSSYKNFLKFSVNKILKNFFPVYINKYTICIHLNDYRILYPSKSYFYCLNKGLTYSISLKLKLIIYECKFLKKFLKLEKKFLKIEEIIIPDIPYITDNSTFIINGIEKIVISKFSRSPGIYFNSNKNNLKLRNNLKIVPDLGNEIDFFINNKNIIYLKYGKKLKNVFPISIILKSLGLNKKRIISEFYDFLEIIYDLNWKIIFDEFKFLNYKFPFDINFENDLIIQKNNIIDYNIILKLKKLKIKVININESFLINKKLYSNLYHKKIKIYSAGFCLDKKFFNDLNKYEIKNFKIIINDIDQNISSILDTIDNNYSNYFESLKSVQNFYKKIKFVIIKNNLINNNLNSKKPFSINPVCRSKLNFFYKKNLNLNFLCLKDLINILKLLFSFKKNIIKPTDMYSLSNLKLNMINEFLEEIFYNFFFNLKKKLENNFFNIKEKENLNLIFNFYKLSKELSFFFTISKYSQYLDKVNDISELSHKRRVTFTGVIGISKKYSGFDCRDLNTTYYSRLCPIETPEGSGIGLINSLALMCSVNKDGFLIAPFYKIKNSKILNNWNYLTIDEELNNFISEYGKNFNLNQDYLKKKFFLAKYSEQLFLVNLNMIKYINVFSYQILSTTAVLIPFLENNDSNRALMACNMMRQALPIIKNEKPLINTGFEKIISKNNPNNLSCFNKGLISYSDSRFIIISNYLNFKNTYYFNYDVFFLIKFLSSNQKTNISQNLIVKKKSNLSKNELLAHNSCSDKNNTSLGNNLTVSIMSWEGFNFEDSIIISEKIVQDELYSSLELICIDINVFKILNKFEILKKHKDYENISGYKNLNSFGIVKIGSTVWGGDIVVNKICSTNSNDNLNSDKRFLYSIFSKTNFNEKDTSFYLPIKFNKGVVVLSEVYFSEKNNLDFTDNHILNNQVKNFLKLKIKKFLLIKNKIQCMLKIFLIGKKIFYKNEEIIINKNFLLKKKIKKIINLNLIDKNYNNLFLILKKKIQFFLKLFKFLKINIKNKYIKRTSSNINKIIRIYIIFKNILKVGDKMSGRYGNKGVISKILPINQMPYLKNGKTIDLILNPLGIPSRMNIGQLMEIHMNFFGLCIFWKINDYLRKNKSFFKLKKFLINIHKSNKLKKNYIKSLNYKELKYLNKIFKNGFYFKIKPFENLKNHFIKNIKKLIFSDNFLFNFFHNYDIKNNLIVFDGRTNKKLKGNVNFGKIYFFKLNHMSEDKLHARSVGPYSLITQQPLRGKSNMGGQRLGEMEVWAIEAYGAFYSLQEMLTIKSDDIYGRFDSYKKIIKGVFKFNFNQPETFDVMIKNINSLMLYIRFNEY